MSFPLSGSGRRVDWAPFAAAAALALIAGQSHAQDAKRGQSIFNANCAICHSVSPGANIVGPSLHGVVGRKAGTLKGYDYSKALRASGVEWTPANLNTWLTSPRAFIPMNRMSFSGLHTPSERADVIAYLAKQK